ncbi:putative LTR transposable element [Pseudoloma neurophilia]|uniref:Putative LTR transposable element n=1 Tax=Pseudoloma neurophilia TaxID=146866 RepID=A0A0R0LX43_9MICR|nr:putative LTR transposable element [Pseudoloma neurophilia]
MSPIVEIYNDLRTKACNYLPDMNQPFFIHADASAKALGAVLSQNNGIVAYFSRKFSQVESRYSTTEKKGLLTTPPLKNRKIHFWFSHYCYLRFKKQLDKKDRLVKKDRQVESNYFTSRHNIQIYFWKKQPCCRQLK